MSFDLSEPGASGGSPARVPICAAQRDSAGAGTCHLLGTTRFHQSHSDSEFRVGCAGLVGAWRLSGGVSPRGASDRMKRIRSLGLLTIPVESTIQRQSPAASIAPPSAQLKAPAPQTAVAPASPARSVAGINPTEERGKEARNPAPWCKPPMLLRPVMTPDQRSTKNQGQPEGRRRREA
jgi:hypothetical protein